MEHDHLEISDFWRLVDELTALQAALLVSGLNPERYEHDAIKAPENMPRHVYPATIAIGQALRNKRISDEHFPLRETDWNGNEAEAIEGSTNIDKSKVERWPLTEWLSSRGIKSGFFFPEKPTTTDPDFLDSKHPRYAPKYGLGRYHPKAATGHGCITLLLLATLKNGGITYALVTLIAALREVLDSLCGSAWAANPPGISGVAVAPDMKKFFQFAWADRQYVMRKRQWP